jgi:hypothetical protein
VKAPRLLNGRLSLREIADIEHHVALRFDDLPLPVDERNSLVLHGVAYACRIDRALPPEQPLEPVLDGLLDERAANVRAEQAQLLGRVA